MKKKTNSNPVSPRLRRTRKSSPRQRLGEKEDGKIVPLGSRVLIRPFTKDELAQKNSFGIILPDSGSKEKSEQGLVVAVGPGEMHDGKRVAVSISVGDKVCFSKYGYEDISVDGEEFYLIKEENILAIIK